MYNPGNVVISEANEVFVFISYDSKDTFTGMVLETIDKTITQFTIINNITCSKYKLLTESLKSYYNNQLYDRPIDTGVLYHKIQKIYCTFAGDLYIVHLFLDDKYKHKFFTMHYCGAMFRTHHIGREKDSIKRQVLIFEELQSKSEKLNFNINQYQIK